MKLQDVEVGTIVYVRPCTDSLEDYNGDGTDLDIKEWDESCKAIVIMIGTIKALCDVCNTRMKANIVVVDTDQDTEVFLTIHDALLASAIHEELYGNKCLRIASALRHLAVREAAAEEAEIDAVLGPGESCTFGRDEDEEDDDEDGTE